MQNRNWTTPFDVRNTLAERRNEKPCQKTAIAMQYNLKAYDTCVIRLSNNQF